MVADQTENAWVVTDWLCGVEIDDNSLLLFGAESALGFREAEDIARLVEKLVFSLEVLRVVDYEHPTDHLAQSV